MREQSPTNEFTKSFCKPGSSLWVDADWLIHDRLGLLIEKFSHFPIRPIISTESISEANQLERLAELVEKDHAPIFSIDVKGDLILGKTGRSTVSHHWI